MTIPAVGDYLIKRNKKTLWKIKMFYILIEMSITQVYMFSKTSSYALRLAYFTKYKSILKMTTHFFFFLSKWENAVLGSVQEVSIQMKMILKRFLHY